MWSFTQSGAGLMCIMNENRLQPLGLVIKMPYGSLTLAASLGFWVSFRLWTFPLSVQDD